MFFLTLLHLHSPTAMAITWEELAARVKADHRQPKSIVTAARNFDESAAPVRRLGDLARDQSKVYECVGLGWQRPTILDLGIHLRDTAPAISLFDAGGYAAVRPETLSAVDACAGADGAQYKNLIGAYDHLGDQAKALEAKYDAPARTAKMIVTTMDNPQAPKAGAGSQCEKNFQAVRSALVEFAGTYWILHEQVAALRSGRAGAAGGMQGKKDTCGLVSPGQK
jgi:hypothetical protein